ncbi:YciI family protein [Streptomyces lushanensis]|nr:YciI family protein [Streptomyces lushanensis]
MVTGYDGTDPGAQDRRLAVRERHLELGAKLTAEGRMLHGSAIVDDDGRMIGSVLILDFPSRAELDAWLAIEPYAVSDVWRRVEIVRVRVGDAFLRGNT